MKKQSKLTQEEFISIAKDTHDNKYDYSLVKFVNYQSKIKIICSIHGIFEQRVYQHIHIEGYQHIHIEGCPRCANKYCDISYWKENLSIEEDPIETKNGFKCKCKCAYCKKYFIPKISSLKSRILCLSGKSKGESRLYCSDRCKQLCPIFGRQKYPKGFINKPDTSRPDQPELRQLVLERDNNQCQICGSSKDLHCHHITGVEMNPIESADIDNCITLCSKCHGKTHSSGQCDVRRQPCVVI